MTVNDQRAGARAETPAHDADDPQQLQRTWNRVVGRRAFLRQAGLAGAIAVPGAAVAASSAAASPRRSQDELHRRPTEGDVAILRFLAAAEIIESDLWEQYAAFGGQASTDRPHDGRNPAYIAALENLDATCPSTSPTTPTTRRATSSSSTPISSPRVRIPSISIPSGRCRPARRRAVPPSRR